MKLVKSILALSILSSGSAFAANCATTIKAMPGMRFDTASIVIPAACTKSYKVTLENTDTLPKQAMGHNLVITETAKMSAVATSAIPSGLGGNYLPKDKSTFVAGTKVLGPKETDSITLNEAQLKTIASKPHSFLCTFPGHSAIMKGEIKFDSAKKSQTKKGGTPALPLSSDSTVWLNEQ